MLELDIDDKIQAGFNVEKISIKADDTWFSLPKDKGLENGKKAMCHSRDGCFAVSPYFGEPAKPPRVKELRNV